MNEKYIVTYLSVQGEQKTACITGTWLDLKDFIAKNGYTLIGWDYVN
jgi:hypothetical protein